MHIESFHTTEELAAALIEHRRHASTNLHMCQAQIGPGDCWVRFVDLDAKPAVVEFGKVWTYGQIVATETDAGLTPRDAVVVAEEYDRVRAEDDALFGMVHSVLQPAGESAITHRADVWPIDTRLFDWATAVDYNINGLNAEGRILLEIAFRGMRAHYLPERSHS